MKENLLYILTAALLCAVMLGISSAQAEKIEIKNPCAEWVYGDPDGWNCYNRTQGYSDAEKLEMWAEVRPKIKKKGLPMPRKVILTDMFTRSGKFIKPSYKNRVLTFPVYGCFSDMVESLEVLKNG